MTYLKVGLVREALVQYYELEALFLENSFPCRKLEQFGGNSEGDDCSALLDTQRKPFRSLIYHSAISEFDLRQCLFSRQAELLFYRRRPVRVAKNAIQFIHAFTKAIENHTTKTLANLSNTWMYAACMEIVRACENAVDKRDEANSKSLAFLLADLCYLARRKLDILGDQFGLLDAREPCMFPCVSCIDISSSLSNTEKVLQAVNEKNLIISSNPNSMNKMDGISLPELHRALQSVEEFDKLYFHLTAQASHHYKVAQRHRSVARLDGELATLYLKRKQYLSAESLFKSLSLFYFNEGWHLLGYSIRTKLAECQRRLRHDVEYVSSCLALLSSEFEMNVNEITFYMNELISVAKLLPSETCRQLGSFLQVSCLLEQQQQQQQKEIESYSRKRAYHLVAGSRIEIPCRISSKLPKELIVDRITLTLAKMSKEEGDLSDVNKQILLPLLPKNTMHNQTLSQQERPGMKSIQSSSENDSKLCISSGENYMFAFSAEIINIGVFMCTEVSIEIGNLCLKQSVREECESATWTVHPSNPSVFLEICKPEYLIVGFVQTLTLLVRTDDDLITDSSMFLMFPSDSKATIEDRKSITVDVTKGLERTSREVSLVHGQIETLGEISSQSLLEIRVPMITRLVNPVDDVAAAEELSSLSVEISATLSYRKRTGEEFSVSSNLLLTFTKPFEIQVFSHTVQRRLYIQLLVRSLLTYAIRISNYLLVIPLNGDYQILSNQNALTAPIESRGCVSLFFELLRSGNQTTGKENFKLLLEYEFLGVSDSMRPFEPSKYSFDHNFTVSIPHMLCAIDLICPDLAFIGSFISFEFDIWLLEAATSLYCAESVSKEAQCMLQYEIIVKDAHWMLSGRKRLHFSLREGEKQHFSFKLYPVSTGRIPAPQIRVCTLPPATKNNSNNPSSKPASSPAPTPILEQLYEPEIQICVCPRRAFVSSLL